MRNSISEQQCRCFVIIPCHNEQSNVVHVIEETLESNENVQVIVIDDGSSDRTTEVAKNQGKAIVLSLPVNLGVGGAVQTGFKFAMSENAAFAVKLDGDGQHPPAAIKTLMQPLIDRTADIVIGSRFSGEKKGFQSSFSRRIGIRFLQWLCFFLTGERITDPTSGFRAYNSKAIKFMSLHYPSFDYPEPEEIILAARNGLKIVEIPVEMRERMSGESTISSTISAYFMLKVTLAMVFIFLRPPEKV